MLLNVEGATGHLFPYLALGYVDVSINIPSLEINNEHYFLFVVPDTSYTSDVPVIIGTNILYPLKTNVDYKVISYCLTIHHGTENFSAWLCKIDNSLEMRACWLCSSLLDLKPYRYNATEPWLFHVLLMAKCSLITA